MFWLAPATVSVLLASLVATGLVLRWLRRRAILDQPNPRSSHQVPVPRGGGIAVVATIMVALLLTGWAADRVEFYVLAGAVTGLAVLSWFDDLGHLSELVRLAAQALAVAVFMPWIVSTGDVFQGALPFWLSVALTGVIWIWFINLFNFMDGIDGLSAVEAGSVGVGLALTGLLAGAVATDLFPGLMIAAAAIGFAVWNWHPAKLFLGDVGSVPLGFLLGALLLKMAASGHWAVALILPLYYLADATITLGRRASRGGRFWQPHREHFYQRAAQSGRSHAGICFVVLGGNAILVALGLWALTAPLPALALAIVTVAALLFWMVRA